MRSFYSPEPEPEDDAWSTSGNPYDDWRSRLPDFGWLDNFRNLWQWDDLAAEISQESRARIALVGLPDVGKSMLFNRLRGWDLSGRGEAVQSLDAPEDIQLEPYGFFVLADLPAALRSTLDVGESLTFTLGDPTLLVYLLDATTGVRPADYRWIATLRASGKPMVAVLNKVDLLPDAGPAVAQAEERLGMPVIPISALTGLNVSERLLPGWLDIAPRLAVPLGRELSHLRRMAARRVIHQVALFAGMMGAQPIPLLDLPFQAMLQVGMVLRVGAAYGHAPTGGMNREIISTVVSAMGLRYLGASLIKFIPLLGWAVSAVISIASTVLLGELAIRYYESDRTIPLPQLVARVPRHKDEEGGLTESAD